MAYIKNTWVDQEVERPKTYEMVNNSDGTVTLVDSFGLVSELGTPVNADNMNHIEEGLADTDVTKYNPNTSYSLGDWVTGIVNNKKGVFSSLKDNNSGKPLTDTTSWEEVNLGGSGSGLFVGQTIFSLDPLVEDGLHLLDGQVLPAGGIYDQFINTYIANLYQKAPQRFCTESDWQASVSQYGVCGKYVYNASANTVRLPKVTGFVEGTLDANALGDLIGAGLPNITGTFGPIDNAVTASDAFYTSNTRGGWGNENEDAKNIILDASRSSSIYGNSDTVQPQSILGHLYIVVATTTKTDVEVNIDNIATDLNNKVDVSNMVNAGSYISGMGMPSNKYVDLALGASGTTYTAPANGWFYCYGVATSSSGYGTLDSALISQGIDIARTSGSFKLSMPVRKGDVVTLRYGECTLNLVRFIYAEGEV
jgi:hypothetical protein